MGGWSVVVAGWWCGESGWVGGSGEEERGLGGGLELETGERSGRVTLLNTQNARHNFWAVTRDLR